MTGKKTYISDTALDLEKKEATGSFIELEGEEYYRIENIDSFPPFLMSIVSETDNWMYASSNMGITAGRKNPDNSLFPYYTDDKIYESAGISGNKTIIRKETANKDYLWEAFNREFPSLYPVQRNLYKSILGNKIVYEEINKELELSLSVIFMNSDKYGWIKKTNIQNLSKKECKIRILDGFVNILPAGILKSVQEQFSTLMDAYKISERIKDSSLAVFSLSSIPVDRAEPSEALKVNSVWSTATDIEHMLLSNKQLALFRQGKALENESLKKGERGAYLIERKFKLEAGEKDTNFIIADVNQDSTAIHNLLYHINRSQDVKTEIIKSVKRGSDNLQRMVADADGIQHTADKSVSARHFSNVMFNIMRGGIFSEQYIIEAEDIRIHAFSRNKKLKPGQKNWLNSLPEKLTRSDLYSRAENSNDIDLQRYCLEYLPLTFSRRHGDPSRPWNRFSIDVKNSNGSVKKSYEGNWRDIFQNWEALSFSYPLFLDGMIARFLNSSTADGYNPYRITSEGIDWEVFDPEDPWSFIGYWGDHQIIYLLRFLEKYEAFFPGKLSNWMSDEIFVYSNVPYRIKSYDKILKNPFDTIEFDNDLHQKLKINVKESGADANLVYHSNSQIVRANLIEKLLVSLLTKLSNFIPDGGIWMNTQRPEWNDANNALVGRGLSMVTLFYIRRFIAFFIRILNNSKSESFLIANEINEFLDKINTIFKSLDDLHGKSLDDSQRKIYVDKLGRAGSLYRQSVYNGFNQDKQSIQKNTLISFAETVLSSVDSTIRQNQRKDGLYNSYNLLDIREDKISIRSLQLMLEGQVAFLSSGLADSKEVINLLKILREGKLYRKDQNSYMLYPDKDFTSFLEKNTLEEQYAQKLPVINRLLKDDSNGIFGQDKNGKIHFRSEFRNVRVLKDKIKSNNSGAKLKINSDEEDQITKLYEQLFEHHSFTGRSGSFFKYEGLGSIYWHMVSKLLLAVGEHMGTIYCTDYDKKDFEALKSCYYDIKEGLGIHKKPAEYGAIPTDPYSHTPSMMGAQQPGMTGQVKEDILSRWIELGIHIEDGKISLQTEMLPVEEFANTGSLQFSFCQTRFEYHRGGENRIVIHTRDNKTLVNEGNIISSSLSNEIFSRTGMITKVVLYFTQ